MHLPNLELLRYAGRLTNALREALPNLAELEPSEPAEKQNSVKPQENDGQLQREPLSKNVQGLKTLGDYRRAARDSLFDIYLPPKSKSTSAYDAIKTALYHNRNIIYFNLIIFSVKISVPC